MPVNRVLSLGRDVVGIAMLKLDVEIELWGPKRERQMEGCLATVCLHF